MNDEFLENILKQNKNVIVKFGSDWCTPCKTLIPILKDIEINEGIKVIDIDVDENPDATTAFGIRSIPTIMYYQNEKLIDTTIGALTKEDILKRFKE